MSENDLRERVKAFLRSRQDLTTADLAAHTELGSSTVKNFINGLGANTERVRGEIERVLLLAEQGEILQPGGGQALTVCEQQMERVRRVSKKHGFYVTQTVRRIAEVLDYCAQEAAIGVVTGEYGAGKTEAVSAWRRGAGRGVEALIYEFDEFTACNKVSFIQGLAAALGLEHRCGTTSASRVFQAVIERLRTNPCLLIFDQCELTRPRICQLIRQIWDRTRQAGVGVVLLAAQVLMGRLKSMPDLGALESRIGIWAPLRGVLKDEMVAIVRQEGIADVDDDAFDTWWLATRGSMRRLMATIDLLRARHQGKRVTVKTIEGVAGHLWGMRIDSREAA
ncbi:MAG: AAA family ATPase [Bryobacteraceae bacterium]